MYISLHHLVTFGGSLYLSGTPVSTYIIKIGFFLLCNLSYVNLILLATTELKEDFNCLHFDLKLSSWVLLSSCLLAQAEDPESKASPDRN